MNRKDKHRSESLFKKAMGKPCKNRNAQIILIFDFIS